MIILTGKVSEMFTWLNFCNKILSPSTVWLFDNCWLVADSGCRKIICLPPGIYSL